MQQVQLTAVQQAVSEQEAEIIEFLRQLVAIPSMESQIGPVGERAQAEMRKLGFDEVWFDSMGNSVGRIGDGPRKILYDSHIDTVGIGDPDEWEWDPFVGKIEDGRFYARGACDEKGSTPGMIYGLAIAKRLGLLEGWTAYYFGNMEEWCDGISGHALVENEGIRARLRRHWRTNQDASLPRPQGPGRDANRGQRQERPCRQQSPR